MSHAGHLRMGSVVNFHLLTPVPFHFTQSHSTWPSTHVQMVLTTRTVCSCGSLLCQGAWTRWCCRCSQLHSPSWGRQRGLPATQKWLNLPWVQAGERCSRAVPCHAVPGLTSLGTARLAPSRAWSSKCGAICLKPEKLPRNRIQTERETGTGAGKPTAPAVLHEPSREAGLGEALPSFTAESPRVLVGTGLRAGPSNQSRGTRCVRHPALEPAGSRQRCLALQTCRGRSSPSSARRKQPRPRCASAFLLFCNTRAEMVLIMSERCFLPHCSRGICVEQDPVM